MPESGQEHSRWPALPSTAAAAVRAAAAVLAAGGVAAPRREAWILVRHVMGVSRADLVDPAAPVDGARLAGLVARRAAREPMALILGRQGFWTLDLEVSADTLIPRADSEAVMEAALATLPTRLAVRRVLDLGTGTGCLLLAALSEFRQAWGLGVDVAPAAAALAARNARANGLADRAAFLCADWAAALGSQFDLVLANPPYIASAALAGLMPEVVRHEPARALDGGADGLTAYRAIVAALPALLAPSGVAVLELGQGQAAAVTALAREGGLVAGDVRVDLGGVARALVLRCGAG